MKVFLAKKGLQLSLTVEINMLELSCVRVVSLINIRVVLFTISNVESDVDLAYKLNSHRWFLNINVACLGIF